MLESIFSNVVEITVAVSLLILLLLALTPLLRRQYTAKWRYWAWLALAARLLIPWNVSLPAAPVQVQISNRTVLPAPAPVSAPAVPQAPAQAGQTVSGPFAAAGGGVTTMEILAAVWLAGTILFLLWQAVSYGCFLRQLRRWKRPAAKDQILRLVQTVREEERIRRQIPAFVCPKISSPMAVGLLRPILLLPHEDYDERALYFILKHEMVHIRRGDIWYKQILLLANALHWFNPLVWLMSRQAGRDVELVCDSEAVRGLDREGRGLYGDIILEMVRKEERAPAFSTYFSGGVRSIKERLRNLFDQKNKRKGALALGMLVLLAGAAGLFAACSTPKPEEETILREARRLLEEAPAVLNWYDGSGAKADFDGVSRDGDTPGQLYNTYYPVTEFASAAQMKEATERVFSTAFCQENLYPAAFERQVHPWYREFDGALYLSQRYLSATAFSGDQPDWESITLVESGRSGAKVQLTVAGSNGQPETVQVSLVKEGDRWTLDSYWRLAAQEELPANEEAVDPEDKEEILTALQSILRSYQEGTVENNPLEPRYEDFPRGAAYPQLLSVDDFTVEKGNEMFGYMVRLPAGSFEMVCFLDYFTAPVTGGEGGWRVTAVTFLPLVRDAKFLSEYLPFTESDAASVSVERLAAEEALVADVPADQVQQFCGTLLSTYVSAAQNPDPVTGSATSYRITLADGTVRTIVMAGDVTLDGELICRVDRSVYGDPEPWRYYNLVWSRYSVDLLTGERTLLEEEVLPDFYAKAYLDFEMEGVSGTRYAGEGDWERTARLLEGFTEENLRSLVLTGGPADQTDRFPMDRSQVAQALAVVRALRGNPWPYGPDEHPNPPTGGYSAMQLTRDDGTAVQLYFNGEALTVSASGETQSVTFYCGDGEANQSAYAMDRLFWEITNPGI